MSGNTRELGRQIAERCRAAGHAVHWQEADDLRQPRHWPPMRPTWCCWVAGPTTPAARRRR
ncbi:hypothetical protein NMB32_19255 [Stenotrophomonas sp. CD2]|nr:hypothetical protein NMB32_19255 [Stenotrophomonas sp. CD2]